MKIGQSETAAGGGIVRIDRSLSRLFSFDLNQIRMVNRRDIHLLSMRISICFEHFKVKK